MIEHKQDEAVEEEEEEHSAIPFLIGDFLHNITDGIAIGAAYNVSKKQKQKLQKIF